MNVLSFDIEDWFHILDLPVNNIQNWPGYESLVEKNTFKILDLLTKKNTKATFFFLGWVAERHPDLVKQINNDGHEIACHGYAHQLISTLNPKDFRDDLLRSIDIIGNLTGKQPASYRGPGFSITEKNEWALETIAECGFKYDSTIYPGRHGHGGNRRFSSDPVKIIFKRSGKELIEFPITVTKIFKKEMCFSGGGYLRLLPYFIIKKKFHEFNSQKRPVMVYLHPREFDPQAPHLKMPLKRRFKCYVNSNSTQKKLSMLLEEFDFTTLKSYIENSKANLKRSIYL